MTWVKLDDQFFVNRKARSIGIEGRALFLASICYCGMQLNDGVFPMADLPVIAALAEVTVDVADRLFGCGMWHLSDDRHLVEVHDYLTWNRSRRQVQAAENAARKAAHAKHAADRTAKRTTDRNAESESESDTSVSRRPGNSRANGTRPDDDELSTSVPDETWNAYAELRLRQQTNVKNPGPWKTRTAANARTELADQAHTWWRLFDITPQRLAACLIDGQAPRNANRRKETP